MIDDSSGCKNAGGEIGGGSGWKAREVGGEMEAAAPAAAVKASSGGVKKYGGENAEKLTCPIICFCLSSSCVG